MTVRPGPWLLRSPAPDLVLHRATHGRLRHPTLGALLDLVDAAGVRGRGGAGFPFATKLRATASGRGRTHVVVNLSEGEPASLKDGALARTAPHLVLDGASACARALGVRQVQLVLPEDRPGVRGALERALAERSAEDRGASVRWDLHLAAGRFVSGEASAVTQLVEGRQGLPVTSWEPTAISGVHGRPTLLSNAETFAHVGALVLEGPAAYARLGTVEEPGTSLLTLAEPGAAGTVVEVAHGTRWEQVLGPAGCDGPVLLGGYHGTWAPPGALRDQRVSRAGLRARGLTLGAGVVLRLPPGVCPLELTAGVLDYLAAQSAGRCGPCFHGLPALAGAFRQLVTGGPDPGVVRLTELVEGRGACAHPDGTVRLVRSALDAFPDEVAAHAAGRCTPTRVRSGVA